MVDIGKLGEGDTLPIGGIDEKALHLLLAVPVLFVQPEENGGNPILLINIGDLDPVQGRLHQVRHVSYLNSVPCQLSPLNIHHQLRNSRRLLHLEIRHSLHVFHDMPNFLDLLVQDIPFRSEDLHREFPGGTREHFRQLVGDRLFEDVPNARKLSQFQAHGLRQIFVPSIPFLPGDQE